MKKFLTILTILLIAGLSGIAMRGIAGQEPTPATQDAPPPKADVPHITLGGVKVPGEEAGRKNPVKPTEESIESGKRFYKTQCAMCHGDNGDGKGELGVELKMDLRDWTDPATLKTVSDGALFYILTKGNEKMPGQEGRMKAEQQWNVVNFIRSVAKKETAKAEEKKPQ
jgi:mono/diheme cytochrome c family protein